MLSKLTIIFFNIFNNKYVVIIDYKYIKQFFYYGIVFQEGINP